MLTEGTLTRHEIIIPLLPSWEGLCFNCPGSASIFQACFMIASLVLSPSIALARSIFRWFHDVRPSFPFILSSFWYRKTEQQGLCSTTPNAAYLRLKEQQRINGDAHRPLTGCWGSLVCFIYGNLCLGLPPFCRFCIKLLFRISFLVLFFSRSSSHPRILVHCYFAFRSGHLLVDG